MDAPPSLRHARHLALTGFGAEAQAALGRARFLVVGLGGLGAPAATWLAAAGAGALVLNDFDRVDLTNLQRQPLYKEADLGAPKAQAAAAALAALDSGLRYEVRAERLAGAALAREVAAATVVLDCSDNFGTRFALNAACVAAGVPLVSAAAVGWNGLIAAFDPRDAASPCYACAFAEDDETLGDCATAGVFGPLTGVIGTLAATEAAKLATGRGTPLTGRLLRYDAREARFAESRLPRDPRCPVCARR
jgi:molybdopterin/thiamine biosynthesis adenylyltransferase